MAISVVNGFLCFSSCDAAKAMKDENPHPRADATAKPVEQSTKASRIDEPAVVLGGALKTRIVEIPVRSSFPFARTQV